MRVQAVSPVEVDARGGQVLSLRGDFLPQTPLRVTISDGRSTSLLTYSGRPGQGSDCYALGSTLTCVMPAWPEQVTLPVSVNVRVESAADPANAPADLAGAFKVYPPCFDTQTYALRSLFPPAYATGPRGLADQQTHAMLPGALLEPLLSSLGESFSAFGGGHLTWVSEDCAKGATDLTLASAVAWPQSGKLLLGTVLYTWETRFNNVLSGIKWKSGGIEQTGLAEDVLAGTQVTDASRQYSQLDALKNAYFVSTAAGADLATCGRNLGLDRDPSVPDDATFARALLAIAYGPRGTMRAIKTALDALLGEGQYTLHEDTLNYPCKVFVSASHDLLKTGSSMGRSYPVGPRPIVAEDVHTLLVPSPVYGCNRIAYPDQDISTELDDVRPGAPWTFQGGSETQCATPVADLPGLSRCVFSGQQGLYWGPVGIDRDAHAEMSLTLQVEQPPAPSAGGTGFVLGLMTGRNVVAATVVVASDGTSSLQACDATGNVTGQANILMPSGLARVGVRVQARGPAQLFVGSNSIAIAIASMPNTIAKGAFFGVPAAAPSGNASVGVRRAQLYLRPGRNYASAIGDDAQVSTGSSDIALDDPVLATSMVGSSLVLRGSMAQRRAPGRTTGPAGSNNGEYTIASTASGSQAHLALWQRADGVLGSGVAGEVRLPDSAFSYPQDLGRVLRVGGTNNNAGDYYIADLVDADQKVCTLPYQKSCPWARVVKSDGTAPNFNAQAKASLELLPTFITESGLRWDVPNALQLEEQGSDVALVTAQPLPDPAATYSVTYDDTLGCIVVKSTLPEAFKVDDGPPVRWAVSPLYLANPLEFVSSYLNQLTAAGVRPVFGVT